MQKEFATSPQQCINCKQNSQHQKKGSRSFRPVLNQVQHAPRDTKSINCGNGVEKCEKILDILIQKDVSDWYIFYMKAELLVIKKEFKKAIVHYKTSIQKSEERLNVFGLGRCYAFLDNIDFAILYYEKSIKLSKIDVSVTLVNIAACYREKDPPNNKKCIRLCDKALEYDNNYTKYCWRGV